MFNWWKEEPVWNTAIICFCLMMGSCTAKSIYKEWTINFDKPSVNLEINKEE